MCVYFVVQARNVMQVRGTRHVPCRRRLALAGTLQTQASRPRSQPATRLTWRQEGCVTRVALASPGAAGQGTLLHTARRPRRQRPPTACCPSPRPAPPRLASPRVSPGAMVWCSPNLSAPCAVRCPLAVTSLARPDEPLRKGAPPGQHLPSLLRHPNLDACLLCLCRIYITDRPMRLANHGPCLSLADASPEYQVFPVLSLILILLMLLAACWCAARWPTMPWLPHLIWLIYHRRARPLFPSSFNSKPSHSFLGAIPFFSSRVFNS